MSAVTPYIPEPSDTSMEERFSAAAETQETNVTGSFVFKAQRHHNKETGAKFSPIQVMVESSGLRG